MKPYSMISLVLLCLILTSCSFRVRYSAYQVISDPEGAHASLGSDNLYIGPTPTEPQVIRHKKKDQVSQLFSVEKSGFDPVSRRLRLKNSYKTAAEALQNPNRVFVSLESKSVGSSEYARLVDISSDPPKASVFLGDVHLGTTPLKGVEIVYGGSNPVAELRFEKSNYLAKTKTLSPGQDHAHVVLQPVGGR